MLVYAYRYERYMFICIEGEGVLVGGSRAGYIAAL
jgi:hypothetical protein